MRVVGCSFVRKPIAVLVTTTAAFGASSAINAHAQEASVPPAVAPRAMEFDIPAQPVGQAVRSWSTISGLTVSVPSVFTQASTPVKGSMAPMDALRLLLEGTGLLVRQEAGALVVAAAPAAGNATELGAVRVAGLTAGAGGNAVGVNGSTDMTATEGSGSYASIAVRLGGKTPQETRNVPQTLSVITADQIRDQKLTSLTDVGNAAQGVTVVNNGGAFPAIYSRGFEISQLQIDGNAPVNIGTSSGNSSDTLPIQQSMRPVLDMALYDHVEILRGADGLYNGNGDPGGVLNLARKRPLDHTQVIGEVAVGSWNNYRAMLDATAPLALNGRIRGRTVITVQDKDQFYKNGTERHHVLYGILEGDVAAGTTISGGVQLSNWRMRPFYNGFPLFGDGTSLGLPTRDSFVFPWAMDKTRSNEVFARVEQKFSENWTGTVNVAQVSQSTDSTSGSVYGTFYQDSQSGTRWGALRGEARNKQRTADVTVLGSADWLGLRQEFVLGANAMQWIGDGGKYYYASSGGGAFNPLTDDVDAIQKPDFVQTSTLLVNRTKQTGLFVNGRFTFWEPLHLIIGARRNTFQYSFQPQYTNSDPTPLQSRRQSHTALPAKIGATYDVTKTVSLYVSRSDVFSDQSRVVDTNGKSLDPITGSNKEVGAKWASADGRRTASLSVYHTVQYGRAVQIPGEYGQWKSTWGVLPDGRQCCSVASSAPYTSKGFDLNYAGEVVRGLDLNAGYTYNKATQVPIVIQWENQPKTPLNSRLPARSLKLAGRYRLQGDGPLSKLTVGLSAQVQEATTLSGVTCPGASKAYPWGTFCTVNTVDYSFHQGGYSIFNAMARYQISPKTAVDLNVDNLGDKKYYQTIGSTPGGNFYGAPRSFLVTVRNEF